MMNSFSSQVVDVYILLKCMFTYMHMMHNFIMHFHVDSFDTF